MTRKAISLLENDRQSPTVDMLIRVCRALGVLASALIARVEGDYKTRGAKRKRQPRTPRSG